MLPLPIKTQQIKELKKELKMEIWEECHTAGFISI